MKKAIVLGGGFAGVEAAIDLKRGGFDVTLISNRDYLYIYPTSIWIPTRETTFEKTCINLDEIALAHGFDVRVDALTRIEAKNNIVHLESKQMSYDYLVVAIGAHKMKHEGLENTLSICGEPEMSIGIRDRLDALMEKGSGKIAFGFGGNPKDKAGVRGGPGFELLFNVHNMLKKRGLRDKFELTFFAPMEKPGARMGEKSLAMMDKMFSSLKIERRLGKKIKRFESEKVVFEDDTSLESDFIMFIPAGAGHSVLKESDLPLSESGFVKIDGTCKVEGYENVYAAGDVASIDGPDWKAKQGHIAEVMAHNSAYNIISTEKGESERQSYAEHLNILCVMDTGDGAAFVYRDDKRAFMIPMPFIGHWLKKVWGVYTRWTKLGKFPKLPGL